MEVLEALQTRRSIRQFDQCYTIPKDELHKIVDLALLSPTALNKQGIDLVVVSNREKIDEATDITLNSYDVGMKNNFNERKKDLGVKNVLTCDASCVIFLVANERADANFINIDAGIMCMSIMTAARNYNYQTLCLGSLLWGDKNGLEKSLGIEKDKLVMAVAIGKPIEGVKLNDKEQLCNARYIE